MTDDMAQGEGTRHQSGAVLSREDARFILDVRRRVARWVDEHHLLNTGDGCLLLLSGGADSMAMLDIIMEIDQQRALGLRLVALHVDYALRGGDSDRDRRLVEEACTTRGVQLYVDRAPALSGPGLQERARELRYKRARELMAQSGLTRLLVAHNRDDQAETVLYRLAKYPSPAALVGMPVQEAGVCRPILSLSADEVRRYCRLRRIPFGQDVSNAQPVYARNQLRLNVLPELARINPRVAEGLAEASAAAQRERDLIEQLTDDAWERVVAAPVAPSPGTAPESVGLSVAALRDEHAALQSACLRRLLRGVIGDPVLGERRRLHAVTELLDGPGNGRIGLAGGWEAVRENDLLLLRRQMAHECSRARATFATGATTTLRFCDAVYRLELLSGALFQPSSEEAWVGLGAPPAEVVLRHPCRGERFAPFGAGGSLTVLQFLADHRVPAALRQQVLVIVVDGAIAWVAGRVAQSFAVAESTAFTLHVRREDE